MKRRRRKPGGLRGTPTQHADDVRLTLNRFERWESEFNDAFNRGDCVQAFHSEGAMSAALAKANMALDDAQGASGGAALRRRYHTLRSRRDRYSAAFVRSCVRPRKK